MWTQDDASEPDPEGASDPIPEGANQLQFLQRHNAESATVSLPVVTDAADSDADYPWAGRVE